MKTNVYIDGFNLYYCALRSTPYKWLNLDELCQLLLPKHQINCIKYFTARIKARANDPGQSTRQQAYFRALQTIPNLSIYYGNFRSYRKRLPTVASIRKGGKLSFIEVLKTDEKGSDVNLATQLLNDAFQKEIECAVIISNDSDLEEPVRIVHTKLRLRVGIINPSVHPCRALIKHADFFKRIRRGTLRTAQFPPTLVDEKGKFTKPASW